MNTKQTNDPIEAAEYIRRGGIVAFPTETVYGLGADLFNTNAVARIFDAKRRPADNPLIAHIFSFGQLEELALEVSGDAQRLINAFFPGPLTVVVKKAERVSLLATAGLNTIGVRMPRLDISRTFLRECRTPVVAPSANLSGRPSPTTWQAVAEDLDGRIDCILQSDPTEIGLESTVVDCSVDPPALLRFGSISAEELANVIPDFSGSRGEADGAPRSPGLRHRHYSPRARVKIVEPHTPVVNFLYPGGRFAYIGFRSMDIPFTELRLCASLDDYARSIFEFFRACDRGGIDEIYCEAVDEAGIGAAIMDRLRRAAEK